MARDVEPHWLRRPTALRLRALAWLAALACACGDSDDASQGESGGSTSVTTTSGTTASTAMTSAGTSTTTTTTTAGTGADRELPYMEGFDQDGATWPSPWEIGSPTVIDASVSGGRAGLSGPAGEVARMNLPGFVALDVEVEVTVAFSAVADQGIGFYVRHNGGYLDQTSPVGEGYAVFIEGGQDATPTLGLWRERAGSEEMFAGTDDPVPGGVGDGVDYRIRFTVQQADPSTTVLRARMWEVGTPEPPDWTVEGNDTTPSLQGAAASFAADVFNYRGERSVFFDDLVIRDL